LAEFAFKALMSEVENKTPSESGREYELITSLVLRGSTALASTENAPKPAKTTARPRTSRKTTRQT
jgi:hypothetical protein